MRSFVGSWSACVFAGFLGIALACGGVGSPELCEDVPEDSVKDGPWDEWASTLGVNGEVCERDTRVLTVDYAGDRAKEQMLRYADAAKALDYELAELLEEAPDRAWRLTFRRGNEDLEVTSVFRPGYGLTTVRLWRSERAPAGDGA